MSITHVITLSNDTNTSIIGWIAMENRTNNITKYIILKSGLSNLKPSNLKLLEYNESYKNEILRGYQSYIYSIYENEAKKLNKIN